MEAAGVKIFIYDVTNGEFYVNWPEIKLIKEFADLWLMAKDVCKCEYKNATKSVIDSASVSHFTSYCKYVFLMSDWKSPYRDYPVEDRSFYAMNDSGLSEKEAKSEEMSNAVSKWDEIQKMNRNYRLVKSAQTQVDELIKYFDEQGKLAKTINGKPVYKASDIMSELTKLGDVSNSLARLEENIKVGKSGDAKIRGDAQEGFLVDFKQEKERREKLREQKNNAGAAE